MALDTEKLNLKSQIIDKLSQVYDPEIPVNIWDLGLVYDVTIDDHKNVSIRMTLTAPGCPMADEIVEEVETEVGSVKDVNEVTVNLTWDPPWHQEMMSEEARLELGF